jgi:hypothetical protein
MSDEGILQQVEHRASFFELLSCEFRGLLLVSRDTTEDDEFEREEVELWDRCND